MIVWLLITFLHPAFGQTHLQLELEGPQGQILIVNYNVQENCFEECLEGNDTGGESLLKLVVDPLTGDISVGEKPRKRPRTRRQRPTGR